MTTKKLKTHTNPILIWGTQNAKIEEVGVGNIIIEVKSYTFEKPKTTFIVKEKIKVLLKDIIKCCHCKNVFIGSTQALINSLFT